MDSRWRNAQSAVGCDDLLFANLAEFNWCDAGMVGMGSRNIGEKNNLYRDILLTFEGDRATTTQGFIIKVGEKTIADLAL